MKTPAIFGIVVLAHCLALGGIVLIQGCETTKSKDRTKNLTTDTSLIMPPTRVGAEDVKSPIKTVVKDWPTKTTDYTVKPGDSISSIAYRSGVSVSEIVSLNGISNKNIIRVGQRLVLPGTVKLSASVKRPAGSSRSITRKAVVSGGTYVVQPGDCLGVIAQKYSVKVDDIRQANGVRGEKIMVGQKLIIPGAKITQSPKKQPGQPVVAVPGKQIKKATASAVVPSKQFVQQASVAAAVPVASKARSVITDTHVVQKDEDLRLISMKWLVSEEKIREFNNITGGELKPGDVLLIPLSE